MPDENKFAALREAGYRIQGSCAFCKHGNFPGGAWGTCEVIRYSHKKHHNPEDGRGASIHRLGSCPLFEIDEGKLAQTGLGAHREFFDDGPGATNGS